MDTMISIHCHSKNLNHRAALNAAVTEYNEQFSQKKIEIYVGTREIAKTQIKKLYSNKFLKKRSGKIIYYFTGLGRLYTDYLWFGKFAFFFLIFICSLERESDFIVENISDKRLLKKFTWKRVYQVNGSGFFENIEDGFDNCHVLHKSPKPLKIAYISRFGKSKHTDKVVQLAQSLPTQKEILIAGFDIAGDLFSKTFFEISKNRPNVRFYGQISDRSKLFSILNKCDLLIYPSKREGCPFTVFEALTTNTLPIVSCTPGSEDLAKDIGFPCISPELFRDFDEIEKAYAAFFSSKTSKVVKLPQAKNYSFEKVKNQFLFILNDL